MNNFNLLHITKAVVIKSYGADKVLLETTLPAATFPYKGFQSVSMDVAYDQGEDYVKRHFPNIPIKIIERE